MSPGTISNLNSKIYKTIETWRKRPIEAIHAQEDKKEALRKAALVIKKLQSMRLGRASDIVKDGISETVSYYAFPREHWRRIRTNNPLERIMKEIRRRIRVVGSFPTATLP